MKTDKVAISQTLGRYRSTALCIISMGQIRPVTQSIKIMASPLKLASSHLSFLVCCLTCVHIFVCIDFLLYQYSQMVRQ